MKTDLEKIRRQLRKMAFGKPNDCVKLAMAERFLQALAQGMERGDDE